MSETVLKVDHTAEPKGVSKNAFEPRGVSKNGLTPTVFPLLETLLYSPQQFLETPSFFTPTVFGNNFLEHRHL